MHLHFFIGFESTIIFLIVRALSSEISQSFVPLKLMIYHFLLIFCFTQNLSCLFEIYCLKFVNLTTLPSLNSGYFLLHSLEKQFSLIFSYAVTIPKQSHFQFLFCYIRLLRQCIYIIQFPASFGAEPSSKIQLYDPIKLDPFA